ncbi:MAG: hypothetical protein J6K12_01085 [Clostridia bacterium]|nr:hypothetical protein [Clostridia bacterium]
MKRLLAIILASLMLLTMLTGCSSDEEKDEIKGAQIQAFITTLPESLDPAAVYTSADTVRVMGLIYEGLTTIDKNGKLENALAKEWEYEIDERDNLLKLDISLADSRWSDGIIVDADDFIYAWSRILLPENNNSNAALLYPILNAKKVKEGLCSVNDLGVYAINDKTMQIVFEPSYAGAEHSKKEIKANVEAFMRRLSSPALVPLREDVVSTGADWSVPGGASYVTNGPFKIKAWHTGELTFERSVYYRCVSDGENTAEDKIVKPYRIITSYSEGKSVDEHLERYNNKESFYLNLSSANKETTSSFKKNKIETYDLASTHTLLLDNTHELFANEKVRQALSLALDRNAIANSLSVTMKGATGLIPYGVEGSKKGKEFRKESDNLISTSADMAKAKQLIAESGMSGKFIAIEYSNARANDEIIAKACQAAWSELGFKVSITSRPQKYINNKVLGIYPMNQNNEALNAASVVTFDYQSTTYDAMSMLLPFSAKFGGNFIDVTTGPSQEDVVYNHHVSGFYDEQYDELCEKFVNADNTADRTAAYKQAEKYLIEKMPVIPVVFNAAGFVSQELSNTDTDFYGRFCFTDLNQKNFEKYLPKVD